MTIPTAEPGTNEDGTPRFGTVNGTSVAAASIGGAAALLAQARPALGARDLLGLLTGTAQSLEGRARLGSGRRPRRPRPGGRGRALRRAGDTFSAAVRGRRPRPALDLDPQRVHAPAPAARVGSGRAARFCRLPPRPRTLVVRPGAFATVHVAVHAAHRLPEAVEGAITIRPESGQTDPRSLDRGPAAAREPAGARDARARRVPAVQDLRRAEPRARRTPRSRVADVRRARVPARHRALDEQGQAARDFWRGFATRCRARTRSASPAARRPARSSLPASIAWSYAHIRPRLGPRAGEC